MGIYRWFATGDATAAPKLPARDSGSAPATNRLCSRNKNYAPGRCGVTDKMEKGDGTRSTGERRGCRVVGTSSEDDVIHVGIVRSGAARVKGPTSRIGASFAPWSGSRRSAFPPEHHPSSSLIEPLGTPAKLQPLNTVTEDRRTWRSNQHASPLALPPMPASSGPKPSCPGLPEETSSCKQYHQRQRSTQEGRTGNSHKRSN